ncbi:MAG: gamma-glutamyl-gamma-aminobutyrate hydrolase family protein [Spirochaetes bacterium]|nr:gamma-glutamyl-gamma-aminobutyrate hydrolase family protein [Spirochaetota bacterium]
MFEGTPTIGITYGSIQTTLLKWGIDINKDYTSAVQSHKANIMRIFVTDSSDAIQAKCAKVHAFIIPGGFDVHPSRYGEKEYTYLESVDKKLDELEFFVLEYAKKHNMPVLGICRGCQIVNVFYGGTLYQDIPTQFRPTQKVIHRKSLNLFVYSHALPCYHEISFKKNSRLAAIFGKEVMTVNSYHHQAVKQLAPGFIITAHSQDGLVEGIEHTGKTFIVGTQFHPEMMREENPLCDNLFKEFIKESYLYMNKSLP